MTGKIIGDYAEKVGNSMENARQATHPMPSADIRQGKTRAEIRLQNTSHDPVVAVSGINRWREERPRVSFLARVRALGSFWK